MSQVVLPETEEKIESQFTYVGEEFSYRPFSALAIVSFFLGICSMVALLTVYGVPIALLGAIMGAAAFIKVWRSEGEIRGKWLALIGMSLSFLLFVSAIALHSYNYNTEVPDGFQRVSFSHDIARKQFVSKNSVVSPHPDVLKLDGQKVFLKGYMYPTGQKEGIRSFVLVKDTGQCCFGGAPKQWDMIRVVMKGDSTIKYSPGMVSVAGTFHVQGNGQDNTGLTAVYQIDGDYFEKSRFSF
ncbi:hypothetical protein MNBD_PLANCTO02-2856 [hydrothermal vent metagenome]|uniref:DUF4190 domain-containing protein n=1 Tax=hydrothermal vent metagenome TaxID=652676 RepID=A0A3B1DKF4_9ZZZZ